MEATESKPATKKEVNIAIVTVRMPESLHKEIMARAHQLSTPTDGWSMNRFCIHAIRNELAGDSFAAAITAGGYDVSPCVVCQKPVVCLPDGLGGLCEACAENEAGHGQA